MTTQLDIATAQLLQTCTEHQAEILDVDHPVIWPDGSAAHLHPVRKEGNNTLLLRGIHHAGHWFLIDLKTLIPRDEYDIRVAPVRDQVGLVMYALRRRYHSAEAFMARVDRQHLAKWRGDGSAAEA